MEGRSDDKGCLVSYVVIGIGVLIYKLATTSLDEYSKNGTVIIGFIALFGGSYFAFKMLIMMFNPSLIPDNYFQQFLGEFLGLTVCLSATAS